MDATLGGFSATDSWRNDIAGKGKLSKAGTGTLRLAGANTFSGGAVISAGTLAADSTTALGGGDVYVKGGTLESAAAGTLNIGGAFTQASGTLKLVMSSASNGSLKVGGNAVIVDGTLSIAFASSYKPAVGDTLTVLTTSGQRGGRFAQVSVAGFSKVTTSYTANGVTVKLDGV
jgi:autotransporter-associated beta strand protein